MDQEKNTNSYRYILYARKSTDSEDRQIQSIEDQKRELAYEIQRRKLNVVFTFEESQSAKKPGRPKYNEMMKLIREGKADGILCWKLNRLARNPIDGGEIQWLLQQGVIKSIITPGREYLPSDNVLMMAVELGMANQFILDLRKDVIRGMKTKAEKGWKLGKAPLGYLNDQHGEKGKKKIYVDPIRFPLVRKLWELLLTGNYSIPQITKIANHELGLRTLRGNTLHESTLYELFTKSFYYGEFQAFGDVYKGKHAPMITIQEFDMAQAILGKKGKPRPKNKRLPYNGIIECGECGGMITTEAKIKLVKSEGAMRAYLYHRCSKRKKEIVCHQGRINHDALTEQIRAYLDLITIPEEFLSWALEELRRYNLIEETNRDIILKSQQEVYDACLKKIDNLINLYISPENANRELLSELEFKEKKHALLKEKVRIEEEMRKIEKGVNDWLELTEKTFHFATYAKAHFDQGDYEMKSNVLRALGQRFIFKDGLLTIDLQNPLLTIKKGMENELLQKARLEPSVYCDDKQKNSHFEAVYSAVSGFLRRLELGSWKMSDRPPTA